MKYGVFLASLLFCCCVNHLWAAGLDVQPSVQLQNQLPGTSREALEAIAPRDAAIRLTSTQLAARSFRRTRKLLTTAARTQQRSLRQIFIGTPFTNAYSLYDAGTGTWWQVGNAATCCCFITKTGQMLFRHLHMHPAQQP
jgi:hypothetical protein